MAFNAYLVFCEDSKIKGESTSSPQKGAEEVGAIEVADFGFGVSMPVTTSRSDGGGATVGRANFDVFTCSKGIDTATTKLFEFCCKGTNIKMIVLHLYRQGESDESGVVKYAQMIFQNCVITKVAISGGGEELPKESLEFNYGVCEYRYQWTNHETGKPTDGSPQSGDKNPKYGWSTIKNKDEKASFDFNAFKV
jgi:type VI secretion system Hcp family effector